MKERADEERSEAERQKRRREVEENTRVERRAAEERERAAAITAAAAAAALVAKTSTTPVVSTTTATSRPTPVTPPASVAEPANVGLWKSSRRSAMQLLVIELTTATFLQPTHDTQHSHLPVRVAHILLQAITHWQLLPSSTSSTAPSASNLPTTSFRSAFSASSLSINQTSFRFLPSSARAKSVDSSVAVFPHPLPAFSSLSAAPHFTLPTRRAPRRLPAAHQRVNHSPHSTRPLDGAGSTAVRPPHCSAHSSERGRHTAHLCTIHYCRAAAQSAARQQHCNVSARLHTPGCGSHHLRQSAACQCYHRLSLPVFCLIPVSRTGPCIRSAFHVQLAPRVFSAAFIRSLPAASVHLHQCGGSG